MIGLRTPETHADRPVAEPVALHDGGVHLDGARAGEHGAAPGIETRMILEAPHGRFHRVERGAAAAEARQPASTASRMPSRSSSRPPGSAPAPPWTMSAGTRLVIASRRSLSCPRDCRPIGGGGQSRGVIARRRSRGGSSGCRLCPRLVRHREAVAAAPPAPLSRAGLLGAAAARASAIPTRASCWSGWRRPRTGATAPGGCSPATGAGTGSSARCTTRASPASRRPSHAGDGLELRDAYITATAPLRAAREQADAGRDDRCRPFLLEELPLLDRSARGRRARQDRLGRLSARAAGDRARGAAAAAPLRPRGDRADARRHHAPRQLPPEPAEHVHRKLTRPMLQRVFTKARQLAGRETA